MLKLYLSSYPLTVNAAYDFSDQGKFSLLWDRDGECRLLPKSVIRNAFQLKDSWGEAVKAGVIAEVPASALVIPWDSALGIPEPSGKVKVVEHPRLDLVEQEGDAGAEGRKSD